jgi:hypothetical protein
MNRFFVGGCAAVLALAAACQDGTTTPADSSIALSDAFVTTTAGFSSVSSSFAASGDLGPWAPPGFALGMRGFGPMAGLGLMGGGLGDDFVGAVGFGDDRGPHGGGPGGGGPGRGFGFGPFGYTHLPSTCTFTASSGRVVCAADTHGGLTVNLSYQFKNAAGTVQQTADSTTDYVNEQTSVAGTVVHRDNDTSTVSNASNRTTTGLAYNSTKRTSNGTSAGTETTRGRDTTGHFVAVRTMGDTTSNLAVPIQSGRPTYPTAGSVTRSMKAVVTYDGKTPTTSTRREVVTYDGSATAKITITQDGVTKNCTMPLPHGRISCS